ncbi:MAG: hypothetical protein JKY30_00520 [Flavobacteriales bacterium]|nr:hypothetical protein [Flavobacteriales bacterium]
MLESEIVKEKLIAADGECEKLEVKVDDNGTEKSFQQFYAKEYTKTDFSEEEDIHTKLTNSDTTTVVADNNAINLEEVKDIDLKDEALVDAAGKAITGLTFKVEVGSVAEGEEFQLQYLEKYGKITAKKYPDGKTRYTFGPFKTLKEAEDFKLMLSEKEVDQKDAFVTVFVFGQRKKVADIPEKQREELGIPPKKVVEPSNNPCESDVKDFSWFVGKDLNNKTVYAKLIALGGSSCAEGLEFKVQIAAYRFPKNYKWNHLKQHGNPLVLDYPDGVTRFTQGSFNTLITAEDLRQKIIKSGQKDAWITPFYNGKRILLEDLFEVNFYGKSIN